MIPSEDIFLTPLEETEYVGRTYKIDVNNNRISGYADDLDAVLQAVYLILNSERYEHLIYSWDYGVEFLDLYGKPLPYVIAEIKRRITEALTQDDRITKVENFDFKTSRGRVHVTFDVVSTAGTAQIERDITISN